MTTHRPRRPDLGRRRSALIRRHGIAAAILLLLASCRPGPADLPRPDSGRLDTLDRAFEIRGDDPGRAAELFADAGPGAVLERARLEAWLDALERADADDRAWGRLLDGRLPGDLEADARLSFARHLAAQQRLADAAAVLEEMPQPQRTAADVALLTLGDGPWRGPAAARLAVSAPGALRREAPGLERAAVAALDPAAQLARSAAWRDGGAPSRAAAELRRQRWRGDLERLRRLELGRSEVAAGSPSRAIAALRGVPADDAEAELVRAQAYRRQGWQRSPGPSARSSFAACLDHARRSASVAGAGGATRSSALELVVECGTESGSLEEAVAAWWQAEAAGWASDRRDWVGRRLGVALAQSGGSRSEVERLAGSLPGHERCLRFWLAVGARPSHDELGSLAEPLFADLYGLWARELTGRSPASGTGPSPAIEPAAPPWSVAWLLERGLAGEAADEWRRLRRNRGAEPGEGVAEAALAEQRGRRHDAIRILREAVPELGTVAMADAPANAIRAYLPLPWTDEVRSAAAEFGLEPWLVAGVARQESVFVPHARSPRGAVGIMQLLPSTARGHGLALGLGAGPDLRQPGINLRLGARELRRLLNQFEAVEVALAAYNAGETRARRWQREQPNRLRFTEAIPIPETYNYVRRVRFLAEAYRVAYENEWRTLP